MRDNFKSSNGYMIYLKPVIIVAALIIAYKVYKAVTSAGAAVGSTLGTAIIAQQTGVSIERQMFLKKLANDVNSKIRHNTILGWFWYLDVDEEALIKLVNQLANATEAVLFSEEYKTIHGDSVKADLESCMNSTELSRIKSAVFNALV